MRKGIILHRSRLIHPDDRAVVDGIPTTSVARTLVDLADVLDDAQYEAAINEAEIIRLFTRSEAERRLGRICTDTGLPTPAFNTFVAGYELDAYWADARLGVQVNRLTWRDFEDEAALAARLGRLRAARLRRRLLTS